MIGSQNIRSFEVLIVRSSTWNTTVQVESKSHPLSKSPYLISVKKAKRRSEAVYDLRISICPFSMTKLFLHTFGSNYTIRLFMMSLNVARTTSSFCTLSIPFAHLASWSLYGVMVRIKFEIFSFICSDLFERHWGLPPEDIMNPPESDYVPTRHYEKIRSRRQLFLPQLTDIGDKDRYVTILLCTFLKIGRINMNCCVSRSIIPLRYALALAL